MACREPDLFNIAVDASVFYATGFVTGTDGTANVTAHLHEGDIAKGMDVVIGAGSVIGGPDSCGPGVDCDTGVAAGLRDDNGFDAEVHVVIRTHGRAITGRVDEQIDSFLGACEVQKGCEDQFAIVFSPKSP